MSTAAAPRMTSTRYDATTSTVAAISPARERLLSLDVFRGITVAGMLLVNNPGTWSAIFPPLEHAEWNGWTPTDLIFPFFLFIVGITTHLSMSARSASLTGVADTSQREPVRSIMRVQSTSWPS